MAVKKSSKSARKGARSATRKPAGKKSARTAASGPGPKAKSPGKPKAGQNKTQATGASVAAFVAAVPDPRRRKEAEVLVALMKRVSGQAPRMWGPSIIGFGQYHYVYDSGREGDMPRIAFSPRKAALTLYLSDGYPGYDALMQRLGRYTLSVACLYIKRLGDVDLGVLEEHTRQSWAHMAARYPEGRGAVSSKG